MDRAVTALAGAIRERGADPLLVGSPGRDHWQAALERGREVLAGVRPGRVVVAEDCSLCMVTLPKLGDDVAVLWLDAHGDFNSPETTASDFLGGMCLAGACGVWETGWGAMDPRRVVMYDARDLDPGERVLLAEHGVRIVERPSDAAAAVAGRRVYVHLDLDVLDPSVMPGAWYPAPGGMSERGLRTLLVEVRAAAAEVVGCEITAFTAPERAARFATIVEPLLP